MILGNEFFLLEGRGKGCGLFLVKLLGPRRVSGSAVEAAGTAQIARNLNAELGGLDPTLAVRDEQTSLVNLFDSLITLSNAC